ncbi:SDR family oxidoreductase [Nonomuraea angiospora]|uniref:SDR family NAD(P)-dependent oxidoreductase n=1 Tax=Nonomuraea angiospora TaxID=46172 RepID=UPI00344D7478
MELQNQTALVTGGGSGIGRATALVLAREGAFVIVAGRSAGHLAETVAEIEAAGGRARAVPTDLNDLDALRRLADGAGDVDILVNNAGVYPFMPTPKQDLESFMQVFDTNVRGPFFLTAALAPKMGARGSGSIVNVSSIAALQGIRDAAAYGATKAALDALTRSWAAEFGDRGVRVNSVAPGNTRTDNVVKALGEEMFEEWGRTGNPLGRLGRPEEVAEAILFLASPRSSYITGVTLPVDGGYVARG